MTMWELQGILLYQSIEHRNRARAAKREGLDPETLVPYADLLRDPRVNPEEAKKIAA